MRTGFNGFGRAETVEVADEPMVSLYTAGTEQVASNVVTL
jgi:hypothetical protein